MGNAVLALTVGGEDGAVTENFGLVRLAPVQMCLCAHNQFSPGAVSSGQPVVIRHTLVHLLYFFVKLSAFPPVHIQHRGRTECPCAFAVDECGRTAQQLKRPAVASAHCVDAVILQKGQEQFQLAPHGVLFFLRNGAFRNDAFNLVLLAEQFLLLPKEKEGKGQRHQRFWVADFHLMGGVLHNIQNHRRGGFVDGVRDVIAGERHSVQPFPCSRVVIEAQGIHPVARFFGQAAAL